MITDTASIKKRLNQHRRRALDCEALRTELEFARDKYGSVKAMTYDTVPGGKGSVGESSTERRVYRVLELEEKVAKSEKACEQDWAEIEPILEGLKPTELLIIRLRYCYAAEWSDICRQVYGRKKDFETELDSYQNKTFKMHGRALLNLAERYRPE